MRHEVFDQSSLFALLAHLSDLILGKRRPSAKLDASVFGFLDPVHLSLCTDFGFELADGTEHVEQQPPGCIRGVYVLVEDDQIDALVPQDVCDLTEVQR